MVQLLHAHPALSRYVTSYIATTGYFEQPETHMISARGVPMLIFPYKQPSATTYQYGSDGACYPRPVLDRPALLTATQVYGQSRFEGAITFVMVLMTPNGAYHFLRQSLRNTANQVWLLDDCLADRTFDELQERLWEVSQATDAVALIEQYLLRYFDLHSRIYLHDFAPVSKYMLAHPGHVEVSEVAAKFKCTPRTLEKQCQDQTGLTPKTWLRLIRFRAAANHWLTNPGTGWFELVVRFGYTDQSHLIRDFKQFTGNPPAYHFARYGITERMLKQHMAGILTASAA